MHTTLVDHVRKSGSSLSPSYHGKSFEHDLLLKDGKIPIEELRQFLSHPQFDVALTLNFERETSPEAVKDKLDEFVRRMDRDLYGSRWGKLEPDERFQMISIIENLNSNTHVHAVASLGTVPGDRTVEKLEGIVADHWNKLVPHCSVKVKAIHDHRGWAKYITKDYDINPIEFLIART